MRLDKVGKTDAFEFRKENICNDLGFEECRVIAAAAAAAAADACCVANRTNYSSRSIRCVKLARSHHMSCNSQTPMSTVPLEYTCSELCDLVHCSVSVRSRSM